MDLLSQLNPAQRKAVEIIEGPVLVLAGPGSGKTRVLTYRVAYLIKEVRLAPHNILAVTFTNKAAREMRERLASLVGAEKMRDLTIGTFHATCARFLRRDGERVALAPGFVIYDDDDQSALVKQVLKELNLNDKLYRPGAVLGAISRAKNELIGPDEYAPPSYWHEAVRRVYQRYQQLLLDNNAVDFDDLLNYTVRLFQDNADVLARYQRRYVYLHVDEFQDTNVAQYLIVRLLSGKYRNIFCVGDEDQSIYAWRGADYRNVQRFREDFPEAKLILLEQNYRSTQTILDVAQAVIRHNPTRTDKKLWTENPRGIPIEIFEAYNEQEEAQFVVDEITRLVAQGKYRSGDFAIFYRTNAQSRLIEESFVRRGMQYKLVGATRFYPRREIKDLLAYLRLLHNPNDSISFNRILNVPPRGIGRRTQEDLQRISDRLHVPLWTALQLLRADTSSSREEPPPSNGQDRAASFANILDTRTQRVLLSYANILEELLQAKRESSLTELFDRLVAAIGYTEYLRDGSREGEDRWNNVLELRAVTRDSNALDPENALAEFLQQVALVSDVDALEEKADVPVMMTLHMAKGLEFPIVFIVGMEEGVFPHSRSFDEPMQMEEERRLAYVGITRAKEKLYLVYAFRRSQYGESDVGEPSRFLADIPRDLVKAKGGDASRASRDTRAGAGHSSLDEILSGLDFKKQTTWDAPRPEAGPPVPQEFRSGDRVKHPTFGDGVVVSSKMNGLDEELEVAFVDKGVKRLIASYAKLEKR
jgi:DNA helicase-2/ATP-dependent DNA helicase PcrA